MVLTAEWPFDTLNAHSEGDHGDSGTQEMKTGQRRERTMAHTRIDILEAAIVAFTRTGLHSTTMQDIAREAGYTAASLYTYFKSKQEIVDAMITHLTDEYIQLYDEPTPSGLTFHQHFELLSRRNLELVDKRRNVFDGFLSEQAGTAMCPASSSNQTFHSNFERRIQRLAKWLRDNAGPSDLGGNDPETLAHLLVGMGFGLFHQWRASNSQVSFVDYAAILTDFFFYGVSGKSKTGARRK
jgi:AcrR family transcriptional regulator